MGCEIYHTLKGVIKEKYGIDGKLWGYANFYNPPFDIITFSNSIVLRKIFFKI